MKLFAADLHIHTALSPCAEAEMAPDAIVREARRKGLSVIAICDHNSALNARPVQVAATRLPEPLAVLAGIEITTAEEVHLLGWFAEASEAEAASDELAESLPERPPADRRFGQQTLFGLDGAPAGEESRPLGGACGLELAAAVELVRRHGGEPVLAHVDRPAHGVFGQLGLFPEGLRLRVVEVTPHLARSPFADRVAALGMAEVCCSDAHALLDIAAGMSVLQMRAPTLPEILLALERAGGRGCWHA